jgi:hypothetical protein
MVLSLIAITLAQAAFEGASIKASDYAQPVLRDDGAQDSLHERAQPTSLVTGGPGGPGEIRERIAKVAVLASPVAVVHSIYLWRTSPDEPGVVATISALVAPTAAAHCWFAFLDTPAPLLGPVLAFVWFLYWIIGTKPIRATSQWGANLTLSVGFLLGAFAFFDLTISRISQWAKKNQPVFDFFGPLFPILGLQMLFR